MRLTNLLKPVSPEIAAASRATTLSGRTRSGTRRLPQGHVRLELSPDTSGENDPTTEIIPEDYTDY